MVAYGASAPGRRAGIWIGADFLKTLAASLALAGVSACSHPPQDEIVPYVKGSPRIRWTACHVISPPP